MSRRAFGLLFILVLGACDDDPVPPGIARFDRPSDVAFVCVVDEDPVSLFHCRGDDDRRDDLALHALVTQSARGEIAAVNLDRGRVLDSRRDIPGFTFVPVGETPIALAVPARRPWLTYVADFGSHDLRVLHTSALISKQPGAPEAQVVRLTVPGPDGALRSAAPTALLLAPDETALFVAVAEEGVVLRLPIRRCFLDPDPGCQEGFIDEAAITVIDLADSVARATVAPPLDPPRYEKLCDFDRPAPAQSVPVELDPAALALTPHPSALALQTSCAGGDCVHRVLVSDEALPLIHVLDADVSPEDVASSSVLLDPLVTGVPTIDVAATPGVPRTVPDIDQDPASSDDSETRYVYAIDATNGSVLVLEDGSVLNVGGDLNRRADRLPLGGSSTAAAVEIEVVTPYFDTGASADQYVLDPDAGAPEDTEMPGAYCKDPDGIDLAPEWLRGVFLTVATSDGLVHFVDVHDMSLGPLSAPCRECSSTETALPLLARHHPRIVAAYASEDRPGLTSIAPNAQARFTFDGVSSAVRGDGTTADPNAAGLDCIACPDHLTQVYPPVSDEVETDEDDAGVRLGLRCPPENPALVCAAVDPWTSGDAGFTAVYEGQIPGTQGGHGRFILAEPVEGAEELFPSSSENRTGAPEFGSELDFCTFGALGVEDIAPLYAEQDCGPSSDPAGMEASVRGDQLVLTSPVLGAATLAEMGISDGHLKRCAELREAMESDDPPRIAVEIRRAYRDRLVIRNALVEPIGDTVRYDEALICLGNGPLSFEVRALDSFTVIARAGFVHGVRTNSAGRCDVDPNRDPRLRGRAWPGCRFSTYGVEFQPRRPEVDALVPESPPGLTLSIGLQSPATKLIFDGTRVGFGSADVVPVQLRYSDTDRRLYMIDIHDRGLVPIPLDPVPGRLDARNTFN